MSSKIDDINDTIEDFKNETSKTLKKLAIAVVVILIAIFIKDASTGTKIASILAFVK